jgi:hypothetical protein
LSLKSRWAAAPDWTLNVLLNLATAIKELARAVSADFNEVRTVVLNPTSRRVVAKVETRFCDLVLGKSTDVTDR